MTEAFSISAWRAFSVSVGGNAPEPHATPPPAMRWMPCDRSAQSLCLAVADGATEAIHMRSHIGAQLAVDTALLMLQELITDAPGQADISQYATVSYLRHTLRQRWHDAVTEAIKEAPLTSIELHKLAMQAGSAACQTLTNNPFLAYQTGLLAVLATNVGIVYLQAGSGHLVTVSDTGEVRSIFPGIESLVANGAPALSIPNVWDTMQVAVHTLPETSPALIVLCTDEFTPESYYRQDRFHLWADLLDRLRHEDVNWLQDHLSDWLRATRPSSWHTSDAVGLVYRTPELSPGRHSTALTDNDAIADMAEQPVAAETFPTPAHEPGARTERPTCIPRATARCRQSRQSFCLSLEAYDATQWIVKTAFAVSEIPKSAPGGRHQSISGSFTMAPTYPGCPHCQAERLFQCSCGDLSCWDGARHAATCPSCSCIGERGNELENLSVDM